MSTTRLSLAMALLLVFVLGLFLVTSCSDDDATPPIGPTGSVVDEELRPYLDTFIVEAAKRGVHIDETNFVARMLDQLTISTAAGTCGYGWWNHNGTGARRVEIVDDDNCWHSRSELEKENLMFHEFGHALLSRPHEESTLSNGYTRTIMCGFQSETVPCNNFQTYYNETMREFYLDELFGKVVEDPEWSHLEESVTSFFEDDMSQSHLWEVYPVGEGSEEMNYELRGEISEGGTEEVHLYTEGASSQEVSLIILRRLDIGDFTNCTGVKALVTARTTEPQSGSVKVGLSLREYDEEGELYRIMFHQQPISVGTEYDQFELDIYCLPENGAVITVSMDFQSFIPNSLIIEDVRLEYWD